MCTVPGLDYLHISQWHLGNFCNVDSNLTRRNNLRCSLTEKCVMRFGSHLRKFILSISVASLPIVQWKPPPLRVVEVVVLRSIDDLHFPRLFPALPPCSFLFTVFPIYIKTLLPKNTPSDGLHTVLQQTVPPSTIAGQGNVDIQRVMQISRPPKPKTQTKETGCKTSCPLFPNKVHPLPNQPQGMPNPQPNLVHSDK